MFQWIRLRSAEEGRNETSTQNKGEKRMNVKKILCLTAIVVSFTSLFVGRVSASASIAFAPYWWGTGSWPGGYIPYTFVGWGGAWWVGTAGATVNPFTGRNNEWAGFGFGYAVTWITTGWWWYIGPGPQPGRIHLNTWLTDCSIVGVPAWVRVRLLVIQLNPLEAWLRTVWFRFIPGAFSSIADGGISLVDAGLFTGAPFRWLTGSRYISIGIIDTFSSGPRTSTRVYSRYDEMMWIADQLTPEDFEEARVPRIIVDPPIGPVCSELTLTVNGTQFAPLTRVYIYYDGGLVAEGKTDPNGDFIVPFVRHETEKKVHVLRAIDQLENSAETVFVSVGTDKPIVDVNYDGKCDMMDIVQCILDFNKKEDPPGAASLSVASTAGAAGAVGAAVPIVLYQLHAKRNSKKKTQNST